MNLPPAPDFWIYCSLSLKCSSPLCPSSLQIRCPCLHRPEAFIAFKLYANLLFSKMNATDTHTHLSQVSAHLAHILQLVQIPADWCKPMFLPHELLNGRRKSAFVICKNSFCWYTLLWETLLLPPSNSLEVSFLFFFFLMYFEILVWNILIVSERLELKIPSKMINNNNKKK